MKRIVVTKQFFRLYFSHPLLIINSSRSRVVEELEIKSWVSSLIAETIGTAPTRIRKLSVGVMTEKYIAEMSDGFNYMVRSYPISRSHIVKFEPDVIERCRANGLRVPEVIADSRLDVHSPHQYIIYKMIPGTSLSQKIGKLRKRPLSAIAGSVFDQLSAMAALPVKGFGELTSADTASSKTWTIFIESTFREGLEAIQRDSILPIADIEKLEFVEQHLSSIPACNKSGLAWGDVSPENIIVDERGAFAGLVDFEGTLGSEFALNIGYLWARYAGTKFCSHLLPNWQPSPEENMRAALYAVVRALRILRNGRAPLPLGRRRDPIDEVLPGWRSALDYVCTDL
ncbi:aminoglycoside phosphotransferase family protein [Paraburkholderia sprentiae WSM5005]|uniref:Aminoglycoside phosphotransferase family protein n=1 Tax=Paraburkholderia sprentiae WSM5005 TaxID=754502 RepID=A0A1I9YI98_9BURK|nr:aminoglycoside phosphotransferase family protein [Paraburkholderia sprentiae]APA86031.2 aminoglycoside phosphotransferase family protein [Paraburkholderia sprentiae WSM5005]